MIFASPETDKLLKIKLPFLENGAFAQNFKLEDNQMKKMLRLVNLFLIFFFFPFYVDAAVTATGALNGFIQIVPADVAVHDASTTYSVSADSKSLGSLSWSHTFSETLVMAAGGHIGPSSNPSSSWADKTGSITYDLSGLDFSEFTGIDYIGLEFHSHANLAPSGSGTLVLKDGATVLSTINCTASDQFGP